MSETETGREELAEVRSRQGLAKRFTPDEVKTVTKESLTQVGE